MEEACLTIPSGYQTWPARSHDGEYDDADFAAMAQELLALDPRPEAVIGWDDPAVARLIQALINEGIRVPEEMRIAGFDANPLITRLFRPLFPTSKPDFARLGELAVEVLAARLQEGQALPRAYYLPVSVLWREARFGVLEERTATGREETPLEV
jgi:DNA-binding LacI/PurR family transcriptional regulator